MFLANLLENVPFVTNKIAADAGLHNFRKRNDLSDVVTTVPVPVQYNFFQQDTDHEVSWPSTNSGLNRGNLKYLLQYKENKITSLDSESSRTPFLSYHDYIKAYKDGKVTPSEVMMLVLSMVT